MFLLLRSGELFFVLKILEQGLSFGGKYKKACGLGPQAGICCFFCQQQWMSTMLNWGCSIPWWVFSWGVARISQVVPEKFSAG